MLVPVNNNDASILILSLECLVFVMELLLICEQMFKGSKSPALTLTQQGGPSFAWDKAAFGCSRADIML